MNATSTTTRPGFGGSPDAHREHNSPQARAARQAATLAVLAVAHEAAARGERRVYAFSSFTAQASSMTPSEIGYAVMARGVHLNRTPGRGGYRNGPGTSVSPILRALESRGWVLHCGRLDGLSGPAFYLTDEGYAEHLRHAQA